MKGFGEGVGAWTEELMHAKQGLYHWATFPAQGFLNIKLLIFLYIKKEGSRI